MRRPSSKRRFSHSLVEICPQEVTQTQFSRINILNVFIYYTLDTLKVKSIIIDYIKCCPQLKKHIMQIM